MNTEDIRAKIKGIVANVAAIDPSKITDNASFYDDLQLDSLSLLEVGVDVDYEFKLGIPEEHLRELRTLAACGKSRAALRAALFRQLCVAK